MSDLSQYRIVVCGNAGSGKSTWIERLRTDKFDPKYECTFDVVSTDIMFNTNYGRIFINFWDMGNMTNSLFGDNYMKKADGCIVIVDESDTSSYFPQWFRRLNKSPVISIKTKSDQIFHKESKLFPYIMSSKTGENIKLPITEMLRQLTYKDDIELSL